MPAFKIDRYIIGSVLRPGAAAYAIALACLSLEQSVRLTNVLVEQKGPAKAVVQMLLNILPEYFAQGLQLGFFVGVLFGFRRLARENAIATLYSAGLPLRRLIAPVLGLALIAGLLSLLTTGLLQPRGEYLFAKTGKLLSQGAFGVPLRPKHWLKIDGETGLYFDEISQSGRRMKKIFIEQRRPNGSKLAISARDGVILSSNPIEGYRLELKNGRQIVQGEDGKISGVLDFKNFKFTLHGPEISAFREPGQRAKESDLITLWRKAYGDDGAKINNRLAFQLRFNAILIYALAFAPMTLIGAALGSRASLRSNDLTIPIGAAIYIVFIQTIGAAEQASLPPLVTMWPAFVALCLASILLLRTTSSNRRRALRIPFAKKLLSYAGAAASPDRETAS